MSPGVPALALLSGGAGAEAEHVATFLGLSYGVWQAVNLAIFVFLLVHFLKKPLADFFSQRRADIARVLEKAEVDRRRAEELAADVSARLSRIEAELAELRVHAEAQAKEEERLSLARAEEEAQRILVRAHGEMDSRVRAARTELTAHAADLAVDAARDILRRTLDADDQKRLLREGVAGLLAPAGPARGDS